MQGFWIDQEKLYKLQNLVWEKKKPALDALRHQISNACLLQVCLEVFPRLIFSTKVCWSLLSQRDRAYDRDAKCQPEALFV
jgi:hypothetical protein